MADDDKPDPKAKPDPKERIAKVVELKTRRKERDNYIARLNARHAAVLLGTQTVVLDERPNEPDEPPKFMALADFHAWYHNDRVEVPDEERPKKKKLVPVSKLWFASPQRRQYEKVVFDPTDKRFDHYNLWRGFSVQPDASKSCDKLLAHIRENICSNNAEHYAWVIGFLAHMVQRPEEKSGVTLVLRGGEGSGKGFLASAVGRLFREHYIAISQREHLVGRFNAHMTQALLIFVDEAMWAGDKQGEGVLKHLVTDHELLIEGKFKDGYMVRNLSRLIIASNEKWAVPAGMRARRWCVLDVADTHLQERGYFAAIDKELKNGGLEAFMHLLMTFDIDSVDIFTVPKTAALLEQKEESMHPHESWWLECLQDGAFRYVAQDGPHKLVEETDGWPIEIQKDYLWASYKLWAEDHNLRTRHWPNKQLFKWLLPLLPDSQEVRPRTGGRKRLVVLPSLQACRDAYDQHIGQPVDWEVIEDAAEDGFGEYAREARSRYG